MSLNFEYIDTAKIKGIRLYKIGKENEILGLDVTVIGFCEYSILGTLFAISRQKARAFWGAEKLPVYSGIKQVISGAAFRECRINIHGQEFDDGRLSDFKMKLVPDFTVEVECKITLLSLTDDEVGHICALIRDRVAIAITTQADLFDEAAEADPDLIDDGA